MIWFAFAVMTAATVLLLVWPLAGRGRGVDRRGADVAFYTSQLAELDADVARGAVPAGEATTTRAEIGRRLLAADRTQAATPTRSVRGGRVAAAVLAVGAVPIAALALYLHLGHPREPDDPLSARRDSETLTATLPRIEAHLAAHPEDGRGFALIAPIYMALHRYDDAAKAFEGALRNLGEDANRRAQLGEALVMGADGVVTNDARAAFDRALADDPKLPEARFYQALAAEQDGDKPRATRLWTALAADSPPTASWRPAVEAHLAAVSGQPPPGGATGAAIAALAPEQQRQAIHGMVDGLAARLAQNSRDVDGWLRLIRAYKVLGEGDRAKAALADARKGLDGDPASIARVEALGRELGLES